MNRYIKLKFSSQVRSILRVSGGHQERVKVGGTSIRIGNENNLNPLPSGPAVRKAGQEANGDSERLQGHEKS